jgi:uncharacterized protein (TIGR04255 family)
MPNPIESLKTPPVIEATAGFVFLKPLDESELQAFEKYLKEIPNTTFSIHNRVQQTFTLGGENSSKSESLKILEGFILSDTQKRWKLLIQRRGVFLNHPADPHPGWEKISETLLTLISQLPKEITSRKCKELVSRYINRITAPSPFKFASYFKIRPFIESEDELAVGNLSMSFVLKNSTGGRGVIRLAQESADPGISVTFNLDIECAIEFPSNHMTDESTRNHLFSLRAFKNDIFMRIVTDEYLRACE